MAPKTLKSQGTPSKKRSPTDPISCILASFRLSAVPHHYYFIQGKEYAKCKLVQKLVYNVIAAVAPTIGIAATADMGQYKREYNQVMSDD